MELYPKVHSETYNARAMINEVDGKAEVITLIKVSGWIENNLHMMRECVTVS